MSFFYTFCLGQNSKMVAPANLCQQCCHKFIVSIRFVKFFHSVQTTSVKTFAEVLNATQHGVSQYETGKRSLSYDLVQLVANYFRIPVEQFVKEELSEVMVLNSSLNIKYLLELFDTMFPIFHSHKALEDEHFQKGYDILVSIIDAAKKNKYVSIEKLESCIESFIKSYNTSQTIEAVANVLGFILFVYAPAFDKEKQDIGIAIYESNTINKNILKKHFLRKKINNNPAQEDFIEENNEFVLDCIKVLKKHSKWSELGDYYLALRYIVGIP